MRAQKIEEAEEMASFEPVVRAEAVLGECPRWSVRESRLIWLDIIGRRIHRYDPDSGATHETSLDEEIGCIAERSGGGFIAGLRSGVWLLDDNGQKRKMLASPERDAKFSRFNDGRASPWGDFWAGTMSEPPDRADAGLYRIAPDGRTAKVEAALQISNGLAFSPDRRWAFHSDTPRHTIWRYPLDPDTGAILGPRQVFRHMGRENPDGASVDAEGCYWSALYGSGRIVRLSPAGEEVASFSLPSPAVTMPAFGGSQLRTLFVTTARENQSAESLERWSLSGSVFAMDVDVPGLPEPVFRDEED